jgi:uncharacterized peroxidase-related enzyme
MTLTEQRTFSVPTKGDVSPANQDIFDNLEKSLGLLPNLYAYLGKNDTALGDYLQLQNRKSTLTAREREVINLVVSQVNNCRYCLSAHTALAKMNKFSEQEILDIRKVDIKFDTKLAALANLTAEVVRHQGSASEQVKEAFFAAGYEEKHLIDVVIIIGDKIITNYLHKLTNLPIDFPVAQELS